MISLDHAKRSDRLMRATTSLTVSEFDELVGRFAVAWAAVRAAKTAAGAARQRRPGGGRKGCLVSAEQKLFFILLYFKAYPTQDVMGLLFGITQGQVSEWVRQLTAVAGQLIPLHRPARQARALNELLQAHPELKELIIDGTERRLLRPQHRGQQKRFYSGRKKRHAVKNVIIVGERKVLWCSPTVPAKCHDKKVAERARLRLAEEIHLLGDSQFNRLLAADRIQVEHTLASVKRLRILRDEFRNRRQGMIDEVYVLPNSTGPRPPRAMFKRAEVSRAKA